MIPESFIREKSKSSDSDGRIATPLRREKALVITSPDLDMIQEATERESSSARSSIISHMNHYHVPYQSTDKDDGIDDEDDGPSVSSSITISI